MPQMPGLEARPLRGIAGTENVIPYAFRRALFVLAEAHIRNAPAGRRLAWTFKRCLCEMLEDRKSGI